jgi:P-type Ca2+ transporter type 2C
MVFAGIVICQIANVFVCRSDKNSVFRMGFFDNELIVRGIVFELIFTASLIYLAPLQKIFNTAALGWEEWIFPFACAAIIFFIEEFRKFLRVRPVLPKY